MGSETAKWGNTVDGEGDEILHVVVNRVDTANPISVCCMLNKGVSGRLS